MEKGYEIDISEDYGILLSQLAGSLGNLFIPIDEIQKVNEVFRYKHKVID